MTPVPMSNAPWWRMLTRRRIGYASAGVVLLSGALAVISTGRLPSRGPTAVVKEAPFVEALVERGTVSASRMLQYGSTIAGVQAKLLEIIPEGTAVNPGDVLFRFDSAPFEDAVARESAAVASADAEALRAREDLRLETMRADSDIDTAKDQLSAAETTFTSEREGRGPLAIVEAEVGAAEAARERKLALTTAEDMRAMLKQGFVTRAETDRAEQALQQAEDRQRLADLRLATLKGFEQPAAIDKSRAGVATARKGLDTTVEAGRARLAQRRAAVSLTEARAMEARQRLAAARDRVDRTTVRATSGGLVVYRELFFGTDKRKPQPGDEVWPSQPLVAVPDSSQLVVDTRVREIDLHKVSSSQRVSVTVDAYPGLVLPATVQTIGALAQEDPARAGRRFFPVTVRLLSVDPRLRTGMTARVEIQVSSIDRALVVPVQALVDEDGETRCYVMTHTGTEARVVDIAARNDLVAAVRRGLAAGETVLLADPSNPSWPTR